jgi:hypothetical protein
VLYFAPSDTVLPMSLAVSSTSFPDLAVGDLLRAAFDLFRGGLHLRIIGGEGESRCEQ